MSLEIFKRIDFLIVEGELNFQVDSILTWTILRRQLFIFISLIKNRIVYDFMLRNIFLQTLILVNLLSIKYYILIVNFMLSKIVPTGMKLSKHK